MRFPTSSVAVAVAVAIGLGSGGCGGSDGEGDPGPRPTTTTSSQRATGLGFTVEVPPAWTDASAELNAGPTRYDVAAADTTATGFKKTVTIIRQGGQQLAGKTLESLDAAARKASAGSGVRISEGDPLTLDGQPAKETVVTRRQGGQRLAGRSVIALHRGELYTVRFVSEADDRTAEPLLRTMLATWRWTR